MASTVYRLADVPVRIALRFPIPCLTSGIAFMLLSVPRLLSGFIFGSLIGLIFGCATKNYKTEGAMKPDPFGMTGLFSGLLVTILFLAFATGSTIETVESFIPVREEHASLALPLIGAIAFGVLGVILGEIVGATYIRTKDSGSTSNLSQPK